MKHVSLDKILENYDPSTPEVGELKDATTLTVWLPKRYKEAYDRLQKSSGRSFSKRVREIVKAAIDVADKRAG